MRILFCIDKLSPNDYNLAEALASEGHTVFVLTDAHLQTQVFAQTITSGTITKEAIELEPNLFAIEFAITLKNSYQDYAGEVKEYQEFVQAFECDALIVSSMLNWSASLLLEFLPTLKAQRKILKVSEEHVWLPIFDRKWKTYLYECFKSLFYGTALKNKINQTQNLEARYIDQIKQYDKVFFPLQKRYHWDEVFAPHSQNIDYLPYSVSKIKSPKCLEKSLLDAEFPLQKQAHTAHTFKDASSLLEGRPYLLNLANYYSDNEQKMILEAYYTSQTRIPLVFAGQYNSGYVLQLLWSTKMHKFDVLYGFREVYFLCGVQASEASSLLEGATLFLCMSSSNSYKICPALLLESGSYGVPFVVNNRDSYALNCPPSLVVTSNEEMSLAIDSLLGIPSYYNTMSQELLSIATQCTHTKIAQKLIS
ncbi:glycosyltransferase family protein [Helicobacter cynogastricus]|uniref:hypothetical protein n=1 Tax=Helicobacter cynogastricus TaxID=329937 RepID=UPI000CF16201|nr:hypothetical protein [Helicobacter cynogastricus]